MPVYRLKPAFLNEPISLALPLLCGRPALNPALTPGQHLPPPSAVVQGPVHQISFLLRFLLDGTLIVQLEEKGFAWPLLHRSFWGEYCGGSTTACSSVQSSLPLQQQQAVPCCTRKTVYSSISCDLFTSVLSLLCIFIC